MSEASIQRIMDQAQMETIHSYKCKEKKLKDLKAMNEMITKYPHRLEQPNVRYNNRGSAGWLMMGEVPDMIPSLHDAVYRGHLKCVEILLSRGASIHSVSTKFKHTVLQSLMNQSESPNRYELLQLLLENDASPIPSSNNDIDLLYVAVKNSLLKEAKLLIQHGLDIDYLDPVTGELLEPLKSKLPSLQQAFFLFNFKMVKLLLLHGGSLSRAAWYSKDKKDCSIPELLVDNVIYSIDQCFICDMVGRKISKEEAPIMLLESLKIYQEFGGNLGNVMDYLSSLKKVKVFNMVQNELKALIYNPMTLKSTARLAVKKCMDSKSYLQNIKKLKVMQERLLLISNFYPFWKG
ncbi:hypothetical protein B566_EDAN009296 [Ephemera danica]|nr:hypothetical protein B566_EDAN009296 [Ephemera danica]